MLKEDGENARVGVDSFAANLIGKIDRIDVLGANRWVRQGQRLVTLVSGDQHFDLVSPVEGVVMVINKDAIADPGLIARDPYQNGWIAMVKSPDLVLNKKNLVQGGMVAPWLQNSVTRLNGMVSQLVADHGGRWRGADAGIADAGRAGIARDAGEGILAGVGSGALVLQRNY